MAKRGETIVLQASRRYKLWLASFCLLCLLLMGIFYLSPKGGPISMILFWLLFVGILGLVNCTRSGDIVLTAKYLESGIFFRRRFPWDKITEVWTGDEHIWWSGKTVNGKKERTCKNQFDHWGRQCKSNRKQVSKDLAVEWIEKIRSVGSEEERKQLIRKLRTNRPPRILRTRSQLSPEAQDLLGRWPTGGNAGGTVLACIKDLGIIVSSSGCPLLIREAQLEGKDRSRGQVLVQQLAASEHQRLGKN